MELMTQKKERNYGIDLLRLFSMLMVVALHVISWGGISSSLLPLTLKGEIVWFIEIACWCAVNCYAIISGYVGVNSEHKYSNIIYLWIQVLFYSLLALTIDTVLIFVQGGSISIKSFVSNLFPFLFEKYWYFTAYGLLFFFMPLLNYIIHNAPRKLLKNTALAVVIFFCCVGLLRENYNSINRGYSVLWLAIMYLCGGYIAKYNSFSTLTTAKSFLCYFLCILLAFGSRIILAVTTSLAMGDYYRINFLIEYQSPLMVAAAVFLFNAFRQMKIKERTKKLISLFAPTAFGVYLIHENPILRALFIEGEFAYYVDKPFWLMIGLIFLTISIIFVGCIIVDFLRLQLFKLMRIRQFANWLEIRFSRVISWGCRLFKMGSSNQENSKE